MGANDLRSSIKEYIEDIEDVNFLEAICTLVQSHSVTKRMPVVSYDEDGYFDPTSMYSAEEIAAFESKEDFLGYSLKGEPLFGAGLAKTADKEIAAIQQGEAKGISLEELKAETARLTPVQKSQPSVHPEETEDQEKPKHPEALSEAEIAAIEKGEGIMTMEEFVKEYDPVVGVRPDGTELTVKQAKARFANQREQIRTGNFHTVEQIRKEMKSW